MSLFFFLFLFWLWTSGTAQTGPTQWTATPFNPPAVPLAVRTPYLNTWLPQGNAPAPISQFWPRFWKFLSVSGWYAAVQVDGIAFQLLGDAELSQTGTRVATQSALEFTPTRTSFLLVAGPVEVNLTFFSPIEPMDLFRQSIPFSYLYMDVASTDGAVHDVKIYSDVSGEWISGDLDAVMNWTSITDSLAVILKAQLEVPQAFTEIGNHAQDATMYYAMSNQSGITWQIGQDIVVRSQFNISGVLSNSVDTRFRAINDDFPVMGISVDLGEIQSIETPITWALGLIRDPVVQYQNVSGGLQLRSSFYWAQLSTDVDVVEFFLDDFDRALEAAVSLDTQLLANASKVSSEYGDIVALAARQVFGSMDITISKASDGSFNTSDVMAFMKDFNPVGGLGGVNPVDVIFSACPAFLTLNPDIIKYLMIPLLEAQGGASNASHALHDLGLSYPNATGGSGASANLGVEDSADMLIMALAHAQATQDFSLIVSHYNLFRTWAEYLVDNLPATANQFTSDELLGVNQTNLAIKGIIGTRAMSGLAQAVDNTADIGFFANISESLMEGWMPLATAPDNTHILAQYGADNSSFALMYNFYADLLLGLDFIPKEIYQMQTSFYDELQQLARFGIPFDSSQAEARSDYTLLTAAACSTTSTTEQFIHLVRNYVSANQNNTVFAIEYDPTDANPPSSGAVGINSPGQGAMFSLLALNAPIHKLAPPISDSFLSTSSNPSTSKTPTILEAVFGTLFAFLLIGLLLYWFRFKHRRSIDAIRVLPRSGSVRSSKQNIVHPEVGDMAELDGISVRCVPYRVTTVIESSSVNATDGSASGVVGPRIITSETGHVEGLTSPVVSPSKENTGGSATQLTTVTNPPARLSIAKRGGISIADLQRQRNAYNASAQIGVSARPDPRLNNVPPPLTSRFSMSTVAPSIGTYTSLSPSASASQARSPSARHHYRASVSNISKGTDTSTGRVMIAQPEHTMINEQLRVEVDNLRRDIEMIREGRYQPNSNVTTVSDVPDEAPPSYF